jgi:signal transduction histidine kinase
LSAQRHTPRPRSKRPWLIDHQQRLGYALVALALVLVVGFATAGALLLHRSATIERQTLRTQMLGGLTFQLQDFVSRAQTDQAATASLAAGHARALAAAKTSFLRLMAHDARAAARIHAPFVAYLRSSSLAFARARADDGRLPPAEQRQVERNLALLESRIDAEVARQAHATSVANPRARFALIAAAIAAGLLIALLIWQFEMQRRAGRIDRDHVERAEELMRLRDDFAAAVSHELRTPLTSIRGYIELLMDDDETPDADMRRRYLEIVDRNSERLLELVSDLLFLAQIEAGKLGIERSQVDLNRIVEECIETSSPVALSRGIELSAKIDRVARLEGDRARLAQVLDNLVSNGLKFTPSGGRVEVRLSSENGAAMLEVEDSGVGIPADEQEHLFERFFRSSNATENAIPGTGLGLTITKAIVERHGGRIEVESTENAGTTVRVQLPLAARVPSLAA